MLSAIFTKWLIFFLFCIALSGSSVAQLVQIGSPPNGTHVHANDSISVEVVRPDSLSGSTEIAVVISFLSCSPYPSAICPPPTALLGSTLYNGPYNPQYPSPNPNKLQPHQNFTVTLPASAPNGSAQLTVTHFSLIGAGPYASTQYVNITLEVG
ncbi:hypothetical protein FIBSPDRAFT_788260 [Athelia psychrophila]|uniref:Phosphatidylglycerol/phosphatidylinositol transfer protein n=1 Tax=Athelia psychrophila TaxID=1759441 RepID=A0A166K116_9AGAM|nr:hypothetical protein FIBSPDRAFT_844301 [Fibularhizoctonia sp. CBS 109695]KZP21412.1 hypothetical protein FIBSPDRAFT_788260 [Fibularhizoctonia sp. CBS 109695]